MGGSVACGSGAAEARRLARMAVSCDLGVFDIALMRRQGRRHSLLLCNVASRGRAETHCAARTSSRLWMSDTGLFASSRPTLASAPLSERKGKVLVPPRASLGRRGKQHPGSKM